MIDEPEIPCEFCDKQFPASDIVLHTTGCNPGEVSFPNSDSAVRPKENQANTTRQTGGKIMDGELQQFCSNCKKNVGAANFGTHSAFCNRHIKICKVCDEPVPKNSIKEHEEEFHISVKCEKCYASVKKWKMPKHQEICPKRMVTCEFCETEIIVNRAEEHIELCGSRTKLCEVCSSYIMLKHKKSHSELHQYEENFHKKKEKKEGEIHQNMKKKSISKTSEEVKPKVGKCPYCKTILNENILLFHQKECVCQPIKCPDCSVTILLKDSNSHFCKSAEENIEISEIDLLSEHLKELFINENCWDTVLQVEDKEFKVHRAILIARSSVFSAMFLHDTSEKQTGVVKIPDCDPDCFKEFLEYLYSGKFKNISSENAAQLYVISDKYNVQELKMFCRKYLMQNITLQNFSEVLILADDHDEINFLSAIQYFFNKHFKEIVITSEWEKLLKCNFRLANKLLIGKSKTE